MQKYKVIVTWEAVYDIAEIADYIEAQFGIARADRFQSFKPMRKMGLEPTRRIRHKILSLACLPIPALPRTKSILSHLFHFVNCFFIRLFAQNIVVQLFW